MASGTTTRLEFADQGTSNSLGTYVDAVSVDIPSVPEPTSLLFLGAGLGTVVRTARRKKR